MIQRGDKRFLRWRAIENAGLRISQESAFLDNQFWVEIK